MTDGKKPETAEELVNALAKSVGLSIGDTPAFVAVRRRFEQLEADLIAAQKERDSYMILSKLRPKPYADTDAGLVAQIDELRAELALRGERATKPEYWVRDWDGDASDENMLICVDEEPEHDDYPGWWIPLYTAAVSGERVRETCAQVCEDLGYNICAKAIRAGALPLAAQSNSDERVRYALEYAFQILNKPWVGPTRAEKAEFTRLYRAALAAIQGEQE